MAGATLRAAPACVGMASFALPATATRSGSALCGSPSFSPRGGVVCSSSRISRSRVSVPVSSFGFVGSSITETRLRVPQLENPRGDSGSKGGAAGAVCNGLPAAPETLRWVLVGAAAVLLFIKNGTVPKHFLVPLVVVDPPRQLLTWLKGDFGLWAGFVGLAIKLFSYIPKDKELPQEVLLPLYVLLLIITAPAQLTQYRGSTAASVVTLALAGYLGVKHAETTGSLKKSFQGERILPSIAIILSILVPVLFLINSAI